MVSSSSARRGAISPGRCDLGSSRGTCTASGAVLGSVARVVFCWVSGDWGTVGGLFMLLSRSRYFVSAEGW